MKTRIPAVLLLFSLLLGLAACGGGTAPAATDAPPVVTEAPETTIPSEYVKPDVNYNGQTITIATHFFGPEMSYKIAQYHALMEEELGDVVSEAIVRRNLQVSEELNVKWGMIPMDAADRATLDKLSKYILAGEDAFEFALAMEAGMRVWLLRPELLTDLNSISTLDLTHSWWDHKSIDEYTLYGKVLNAPGDLSFYRLGSPITIFFNKKIIADNALGSPYALVRDGKWTLDAMMEMSTKAYKDVNGNGTVDVETDILGFMGEQSTTLHMYFGSGLRMTEKDANGEPVPVLNTEKTVKYLEKWVPFIQDEKKSIYVVNVQSRYKSTFTDLFEPKLKNDTGLFFSNQLLIAMDLRDMETDFGILPVPKADEDQKDYIGYCNGAWNDLMIVPVTNDHLDRTGVIADALGYYGQQYIVPAFIDTTILSRDVRDEESAEMVALIFDSVTCDIGSTFNWGSMNNVLYDVVGAKDAGTFASKYASKESSIKSVLATTLETLKK